MSTQRQHASEIVEFILSVASASAIDPKAKDKAVTWTKLKLDRVCEQAREKEQQS